MTIPPTRKAASSVSGTLSGELAELLDRHGGDLDADMLRLAIDRARGAATSSNASSKAHCHSRLQQKLLELLEDPDRVRDRDEILDLLESLVDDLRSGTLEPEVEFESTPSIEMPPRLILVFGSPFALRRKLPSLPDIQEVFIETDVRPMPLVDMEIRIRGRRVDEDVRLEGRVARTAPSGIALRFYRPSREAAEQLQTLEQRMWSTSSE